MWALCKNWTGSWKIGPTPLLGCRSGSLFHWSTGDCDEDGGVRFSRDKVMMSACSVDLLFLGIDGDYNNILKVCSYSDTENRDANI